MNVGAVQQKSLLPTPATAAPTQAAPQDPVDQVDRLIADLQAGRIKYAPEIQAHVRPQPLTLSDFPCKKYMLRDPHHVATEIVPRQEEPLYTNHVHVDGKLTYEQTKDDLKAHKKSIPERLETLYAQGTESLLVMVDGDNAAGKDGLYKNTLRIDPLTTQGAHPIKAPKGEAAKHAPEWRIMDILPEPGQITLLNRSHYGDVVFGCKTAADKAARTADIIETEYGLTMGLPMTPDGKIALPDATGHVDPSAIQRPPMRLIKVLPAVSDAEQAHRLAARLAPDGKRYKANQGDVAGHPDHTPVQNAYAEVMAAAARPWAPAYVIPNDLKIAGQRKFAQILDDTLDRMDPQVSKHSADYSDGEATKVSRGLDREYQRERNPEYTRKH
ncbi:MAG: polyphosphate kinase 2 family protein [Candidatus Xenobia bacterium]